MKLPVVGSETTHSDEDGEMKTSFALGTVGAALAGIFLALTAAPAAQAEQIEVLFANSNLITGIQQGFKNTFERTHSGDTVSFQPALEYNDAMAITLRQSVVGALHDLGYYGVSDVCTLADRGIAQPLDGLIQSDPAWKSLGVPDSALEVTKCHGVTYGVPVGASFMVVIFNKKLVAEAGGDPNNLPKTWPEIIDLGRKIKAKSGGISMSYMASSSWSFMTLVQSQGGQILTPDGKNVAFDSPAGLKALQILADVGAARDHVDMTKAQGRQAFVSGTLGILVDSSSGLTDYKKATKDSFEIGVVSFPLAPGGKLPPSGFAGVLQATNKDKQKLAWDYLKYSASADGQTLIGKTTGFLPFNETAIHAADKLGAYYAENPELSVAAESIKNATVWPSFPGPNGLKIHQLVMDYLQKVYVGAMTPEVALPEMAEKTRALLK
ncbi:extracellular solute-binding protein [Dongia sedimenti]|uniref:Extracellular solute-binding protein n=1 Tax=Dongia sedimenti TaxID=3064282 RepID=A0ABU0YTK9_9PROT|nr:extracellular solute-binding protein [Rhodospirillaceae bacterium R-7]